MVRAIAMTAVKKVKSLCDYNFNAVGNIIFSVCDWETTSKIRMPIATLHKNTYLAQHMRFTTVGPEYDYYRL